MQSFIPPTADFDGYIFDCDGTLADTMPLHHEAWKSALAQHGAQFDFSWEVFVSRAGMGLEQTVEELSAQFQFALDAAAVAAAQRARYAALELSVRPVVDVLEFARACAPRRPVSVASGSLRPTVARTLELIDAAQLFPIIITPEDVQRGKPDPEMFLLAAERMGVAPERCLVFEDADLGMEAARRAGMAAVRVTPPRPRAA